MKGKTIEKMNKKLYEQAKKNVEKALKKELNEKIMDECNALVYQSQLKEDKRTMKKLRNLYKKLKKIQPWNFGHSLVLNDMKREFERIISAGKYHPKEIRGLENDVKRKLKSYGRFIKKEAEKKKLGMRK